jgi:hypothetical protein
MKSAHNILVSKTVWKRLLDRWQRRWKTF